MLVEVCGHKERIEVRIAERIDMRRDWGRFERAVELISDVVNKRPHYFVIPPRGAMWRTNIKSRFLPESWEIELEEAVGALASLLLCQTELEHLFVMANYIEPQVKALSDDFALIKLYPLSLTYLLPYPIPTVEFTDDMEQITEVGTATLEGGYEIAFDATAASYRRFLRRYIRNITPGFRLFLARIVIYHALVEKIEAARRITPVVFEGNPILRRLQLIVEEDLPICEKIIAARLLLKHDQSDVAYTVVRNAIIDTVPQIDTLLWAESVTKRIFRGE